MFIRYYFERKDARPYSFDNVQEDVETISSHRIRFDRINSLARPDLAYNFHFIPIYKTDGDEKYHVSSASIYVNNFWINGCRVFFLPTNNGVALSLKPGRYNFKVEYVIDNYFVSRENPGGYGPSSGFIDTRTYSTKINERKTLELNDVYIDETKEYYLCLLIKIIPIFEKVYDYRKNKLLRYSFDRFERKTKFYLVDKQSLIDCCSDGLRAGIHPHHYPINRDYSAYNFKNETYDYNTPEVNNPVFNRPFVINKRVYKSGNYYYGPMVNDKEDRFGLTYEDGTYYWCRYKWDEGYSPSKGYGTHYFSNGEHIFGFNLTNHILEGECIHFYPNGDCELLFYYEGKPIGNGVFFYRNGDYDYTSYSDGVRKIFPNRSNPNNIILFDECITGKRILEFSRSKDSTGIYCGEAKDGVAHGFGTVTYNDGSRFCGYFNNGKRCGIGTCYFADGKYMNGYYLDDKANGQFRIYYPNGSFKDAYYENNIYLKEYWFDNKSSSSNSSINSSVNSSINTSSSLNNYSSTSASSINKNITSSQTSSVSTTSQTKPVISKKQLKYFDGSRYYGEVNEKSISHGKGTYYFKNGDVYEGLFLNGERTGFATLSYTNGDKYVGCFKNGIKDDLGTFYFKNGDVYNGYWKNNNFHGKGKYTWKDGSYYDGEWQNSKRQGKGEYKYTNGNRYVGDFVDDKKEGQGTYYFANGEKYIGEFKNDKKNGLGKLYDKDGNLIKSGVWKNDVFDDPNALKHNFTFANAKIGPNDKVINYDICKYVGMVKDNVPHLVGTYYYNNGDVYSGCFSYGIRENFGTYIFRNGSHYIGEFINGKYEGFGFKFENDGFIYSGLWKQDKKNGIVFAFKNRECSIYWMQDGRLKDILHRDYNFNANIKKGFVNVPILFNYFDEDLYIGELDSLGMNGYGKLIMENGSTYVGFFKNNDFYGLGCYSFKNGDIYIGQFEDSCFNGLGARIYSDGSIVIGHYEQDELVNVIRRI